MTSSPIQKENILHISIVPEQADIRLDVVLSRLEPIKTRSRAAYLIQNGRVSLKGKTNPKPSYKVKVGDQLTIEFPEPTCSHLKPYDYPLDIVFEDDHLIVINKPAGLVVHPSPGHEQDTLVNALLHHTQSLSMGFDETRPGIVHRLDKGTSGLIVIAKTNESHWHLADQFKNKLAGRVYWALVYGTLSAPEGRIESHLIRHPIHRKKMASEKPKAKDLTFKGKLAITHYKLLKTHFNNISWVELKLETGRTHQIRVHLTDQGHPLLGDLTYGQPHRSKNLKSMVMRKLISELDRVALHARRLELVHPHTSELLKFEVPWPSDLIPLIKELGF